jgi:hypothetical protein
MRTDAVIAIVGAHDARNPASRLTMPVSDETVGPGSWPDSSGGAMNASDRGCRQQTPALLGRRLASAYPPYFSVAVSQRAASQRAASQRSPRTLRRATPCQGKTS